MRKTIVRVLSMAVGTVLFCTLLACRPIATVDAEVAPLNQILIPKSALTLNYQYDTPSKSLAYQAPEDPLLWQIKCRDKLQELIVCDFGFAARSVQVHHTSTIEDGTVYSLIMQVDATLSIPAYLLVPDVLASPTPVIALQGHGYVEGVLGIYDDYHHAFGLELYRAGFMVLAPELRGFGSLVDLAAFSGDRKLDYYNWGHLMAFTLVSDAFQKGHSLIGDTIQDLYAWASYLCDYAGQEKYSVAGISYGGDLALILAALDKRVTKTFASGTLGSMAPIFDRCYNAPAHCIPNILQYMDRQEIASCIAPRSLCVHYGVLDVPSPTNYSAAFNETAMPAFQVVEGFYQLLEAGGNISLVISPGLEHEMDNAALISYLLST